MKCNDCSQEYSGFWSIFSSERSAELKYLGELEEQYKQLEQDGIKKRIIGRPMLLDLCTGCLTKRNKAAKALISTASKDFGPIVRGDFIRGKELREIGWIKVRRAESPSEYEAKLKELAVLIGANAVIKSNWVKESERYQAGRGKKGNPYYQTRHYFSGEGLAVLYAKNPTERQNRTEDESLCLTTSVAAQPSKLVLVDALNVALAANAVDFHRIRHLAVELKSKGFKVAVVFDANSRYKFQPNGATSNSDLISTLGLTSEEAFFVPAGIKADEFLLQIGSRDGSMIISNDRFLDYQSRFPDATKDERLAKFAIFEDSIVVPLLSIDVKMV